MKIKMECLIDSTTGKPLEVEVPDDYDMGALNIFRQKAWESGKRFRMGLDSMNKEISETID